MPLACPCCATPLAIEDSLLTGARRPDQLVQALAWNIGASPMEEAILLAVWRGAGRKVMPAAVYSAMYADDPDGGPNPHEMTAAAKVALCRLRGKLRGTGVWIQTAGYGQGHRLLLGDAARRAEAAHDASERVAAARSGVAERHRRAAGEAA